MLSYRRADGPLTVRSSRGVRRRSTGCLDNDQWAIGFFAALTCSAHRKASSYESLGKQRDCRP
jgi:hypothetical protein